MFAIGLSRWWYVCYRPIKTVLAYQDSGMFAIGLSRQYWPIKTVVCLLLTYQEHIITIVVAGFEIEANTMTTKISYYRYDTCTYHVLHLSNCLFFYRTSTFLGGKIQ